MPERRICELLAARELLREEAGDVVPRGVRERGRVRLEGLDEHLPGRVPAATPRELGNELERPLLGAEVGEREPGVRIHDRGHGDSREVVALRDHLGADQRGRVARPRNE